MRRIIPITIGAIGLMLAIPLNGFAESHNHHTAKPADGYYSLIRSNIWTGDEYVEDFNMGIQDCVDAMWISDEYNDGFGWSCTLQPDGEIVPMVYPVAASQG